MEDEFLSLVSELLQGDGPSKRLASLLASIKDELVQGNLTQSEFDELLGDVTELEKIVANTSTILMARRIRDAIEVLIELAKLAKI